MKKENEIENDKLSMLREFLIEKVISSLDEELDELERMNIIEFYESYHEIDGDDISIIIHLNLDYYPILSTLINHLGNTKNSYDGCGALEEELKECC